MLCALISLRLTTVNGAEHGVGDESDAPGEVAGLLPAEPAEEDGARDADPRGDGGEQIQQTGILHPEFGSPAGGDGDVQGVIDDHGVDEDAEERQDQDAPTLLAEALRCGLCHKRRLLEKFFCIIIIQHPRLFDKYLIILLPFHLVMCYTAEE